MRKLTLEEIAPYLPYKLMWHDSDNESRTKEREMTMGNVRELLYYSKRKPILRPLSDLLKENLMGFSPLEEMKLDKMLNWCDAYDDFLDCCDIDKPEYIPNAPYEIVQWLLKNNYDVFDLIAAGLAIDKNTLKSKINH